MNQDSTPNYSGFGGSWTSKKLDILEKYLNAYTTTLKEQSFSLMYVDAFAGTGKPLPVRGKDNDSVQFLAGSAARAIAVDDHHFDKLIFVENDPERHAELRGLQEKHNDRNIEIQNQDANDFLQNFKENWEKWRGVLFLDPFSTEVEWNTIKTIAGFKSLDTWILFPTHAVMRMLPTSKQPDDISNKLAERLNRVYGDDSWRELYSPNPQPSLFSEHGTEYQRDHGVDGLIKIYKNNLEHLFNERFLNKSKTLTNSKNAPLFEFLFCVGNTRGIGPASRIAKHILDNI